MGNQLYHEGYIVGVEGGAMSYASQAIFTPPTRLYHFLVIGQYIPEDDDYVILEAIASGVRVGRLSWYKDDLYVVFRVNDPDAEELGRRACYLASQFGRWGYDYMMYLHLGYHVPRVILLNLIKERRFRRIKPSEIPYYENHAVICTEFANALWRQVGRPPIAGGVNPFPAGYIEAYLARKLVIAGANIPERRAQRPLPAYLTIIQKYLEQEGAYEPSTA